MVIDLSFENETKGNLRKCRKLSLKNVMDSLEGTNSAQLFFVWVFGISPG
jgi:hypothetical protein